MNSALSRKVTGASFTEKDVVVHLIPPTGICNIVSGSWITSAESIQLQCTWRPCVIKLGPTLIYLHCHSNSSFSSTTITYLDLLGALKLPECHKQKCLEYFTAKRKQGGRLAPAVEYCKYKSLAGSRVTNTYILHEIQSEIVTFKTRKCRI